MSNVSLGARAFLEVISVRAINWISLYAGRSKAIKWVSFLISNFSAYLNLDFEIKIAEICKKLSKIHYFKVEHS